MSPQLRYLSSISCLAALLAVGGAWAQESNEDQPPDPDTGESTIAERTIGILPNPWTKHGIKFAATYIGEVLSNSSGGLKQAALFQGRGALAVDIDFEKLMGWRGLTSHANILAIHGEGFSRSNLQNFFVTSGVEALPTVRLYDAYFEQKFFDGKWSIRLGQFAADSEFISTKYTDVFTNASLGWPAITALNLPSGGPSPPLAAVGSRLFASLSDNVTVLAAIFDGDPAGPGSGDSQQRNRYGLNFRVIDPPLVLSEAQFSWKDLGSFEHLRGALKLGGWRHFGNFNNERFDNRGLSLADPASSGVAALHRGNQGLYAVFEQRIFSTPDTDNRGIGIFARVSSSPNDRNLISLYADGGVDFLGLVDSRPNDKFGVAFGYARVSRYARHLDADFQALNGARWPARSFEALTTISYQYEVREGWNLLPNIQYIVRPGGGATDPLGPLSGRRLRDATIAGFRSVVKF